MKQHWNIQINIQRVDTQQTAQTTRGVAAVITGKEREIFDVLKLAVTADTEEEAYDKAQRMLTANDPRVAVITSDQNWIPSTRTERPAYERPIRDNPQA